MWGKVIRWAVVVAFVLGAVPAARAQGMRPLAIKVDPRAAAASARLQPHTLFDSAYGRPRRIWVYTPPGYDARAATPYPLLVAFDGVEYRDTMPVALILDTLLATKRAPAFVAVLIDDSASAVRIADLGNAPRMTRFLANQLMPWVRGHYHVTRDPHRVVVTGSSAGGLAASFVALERPDLFGNVIAQSGAFWRGANASNGPPFEWLTSHVRQMKTADVTFVLDVGELEDHATLGGSGPNFLESTRHFRDALQDKGYALAYMELRVGEHSPATWAPRLPVGIVRITSAWASR